MPSHHIVRSVEIASSPRVKQVEGLFDLPVEKASTVEWDVCSIPTGDWKIGAIVGPSGSGKTTIAQELFPDAYCRGFDWKLNESTLDSFPRQMSIKDICKLLSSVGFSSPPAWLRPFHVLSQGEQFRVTVARMLAQGNPINVLDEYTSVVDRTVAKIGSAAVAKTVRKSGTQFVAVSCHYDIIDWLCPDWVYDVGAGQLKETGSLQRPAIHLEIVRVHHSAWNLFREYHYLTRELNRSAACYVAKVDGQPVAFVGMLSHPHATKPGWRFTRLVCLPDYQGIGIAIALFKKVAEAYAATHKPVYARMSHPAVVGALTRDPAFRVISRHAVGATKQSSTRALSATRSARRATTSFRYVGKRDADAARAWGVLA